MKFKAIALIWLPAIGRPPHGGRGLKCIDNVQHLLDEDGRPPHGGRGLKFARLIGVMTIHLMSPPARGAWIEIGVPDVFIPAARGRPPHGGRGLKSALAATPAARITSPPARGAWIEIGAESESKSMRLPSPPARGAWIEMAAGFCYQKKRQQVAPRTGGVD